MVDDPKYDVAISLLSQDVNIGQDLYNRLSDDLDVFFYPRNQEDLAGTDGMRTTLSPFLASRVMLILYREKWGQTEFTAVEELAIKEACFKGHWNGLFVLALDGVTNFPKWIPQSHITYDLSGFKIDEAVGAIKARVLDNHGHFKPMSPVKRAQLLKADESYRQAQRIAISPQGEAGIKVALEAVFTELSRQCEEVNAAGDEQIGFGRHADRVREFVMTDGIVGMVVFWQGERSLTDTGYLVARQFNDRLNLPTDERRAAQTRLPQQVGEKKFEPELSVLCNSVGMS